MRSSDYSLLIVQPWFTAKGHPAQSLMNTAKGIGVNNTIGYLVSRKCRDRSFVEFEREIKKYGTLGTFKTPTSSIRINTVVSLFAILKRRIRCDHIFFFDAHLVILALVWPWLSSLVRARKLSLIHLGGPEKIRKRWFASGLVSSFLAREDTQLFLRTEELADAWLTSYPGSKFGVLPSLEMPEIYETLEPSSDANKLKCAVVGQIRPSKGIEWLVPLFEEFPEIGELTIAGTFYSKKSERDLVVLQNYPNFINRFLPEKDLMALAANQHYILMLYDNWDYRMEAATLYLAAKVNRPVIARDNGWCGRMIGKYKCGIFCRPGDESADFFLKLPKPGAVAYADLLSGLEKFRSDHSGAAWRTQFLEKLEALQ